ncbi:opsin-5-like [Engraulis encrasicolus]|uniref:opsin-5-like n=1 Tax=Engraulis encrasicolus TaxID=184585 RepID=UPI002FD4FBB1
MAATVSALGNATLLITSMRRFSRLKPPELLLMNLALSDMVAVVCMLPLLILSAFHHRWLGGERTCAYYGLMAFLHGGTSIATFTTLAIVRCMMAFNTHRAKKYLTRKLMFIIITFIWLHSLLWSLLPLVGWGQYGPEPHGLSCTLAWGQLREGSGGLSFIFSVFAVLLGVPALVIVTCYSCIACRLSWQYRKMLHCRRLSRKIHMVQRAVWVAVVMSAGFLMAWTPYAATSFWLVFNPTSPLPPVVSLLPTLFANSASAYNPIILYFMSSQFRSNARKLAADVCRGVASPENSPKFGHEAFTATMSTENALSA